MLAQELVCEDTEGMLQGAPGPGQGILLSLPSPRVRAEG